MCLKCPSTLRMRFALIWKIIPEDCNVFDAVCAMERYVLNGGESSKSFSIQEISNVVLWCCKRNEIRNGFRSTYWEVMCKVYVKHEIAKSRELFAREFENHRAKLVPHISPFSQNQGGCDGWRLDEALRFSADNVPCGRKEIKSARMNYLPNCVSTLNEWVSV